MDGMNNVSGSGARLTAVQTAVLDALKMAPGGMTGPGGAAAGAVVGAAAGAKGLSEAELKKGVEQRLGVKKLEGAMLAQYTSGLAALVAQGLVKKVGVGAAAKYTLKK